LITGAGGQLARALIETAPIEIQVYAVSKAECDITKLPIVEEVFRSFRPDVVINTAAYNAVDTAEESKQLALSVNATGAENVAKVAELGGSRLIHISTDYVFDGTRSTPYPPEATPNPLNTYGASKLAGEQRTLRVCPRSVVVRTSWLYSTVGNNFLTKILSALRGQRPVLVVSDQTGSPTSAHEFARAIWKMPNVNLRGVYHWANQGSGSRYDFAREIAKTARQLGLLAQAPDIVAVTTEMFPRAAKRPSYSVLDSTKLAGSLRVSPSAWQSALREEIARGLERLSGETRQSQI
jgi:dTDP-4-dehydrorhamnose reductase